MIHREHILQKHIKILVRDVVDARHEFFAFDRSKKTSQFSHAIEKSRGVRAATPDTLLRVKGHQPIWCELKTPGNKPSPEQIAMGVALQEIGDIWFWTNSVMDYFETLKSLGVPIRTNAEYQAMHHDASVLSMIAKAGGRKMPRTAAPRKSEPRKVMTPAQATRMRMKGVMV